MHYDIKQLPKSEIEISFVVLPEELEPFLNEAVKEIGKETEVPGFRKGMVPREVLEKHAGLSKILERAAEKAVKKFYVEAVTEKNIEALGKPTITITKLAPRNPLEFVAKVAVLPDLKLPDWRKIAKDAAGEKRKVAISDKEFDDALIWLRESRAKETAVSRPAATGDAAQIDFETRDETGKMIEGACKKNYSFILGKGSFVPGFEDELRGMSAGEDKSFRLEAPQAYWNKDIAGKSLDFFVRLKGVRERILPELTDEFAKSLGKLSSAAELRESIGRGISAEKEEKERARLRLLILKSIADDVELEIPEVLVRREVEIMLDELKTSLGEAGLPLEEYLRQVRHTEEELRKEFRQEAERRAKFSLILREIAREAGIEPLREEVEAEANKYLQRFSSPREAEKSIDLADLIEYTKGVLRNEKTFQLLEQLAAQ